MNKEFNSCYLPSFLTEVLHNFALNFYKLRGYQDRCEDIVPLTVKSFLLQKIKDYYFSFKHKFILFSLWLLHIFSIHLWFQYTSLMW